MQVASFWLKGCCLSIFTLRCDLVTSEGVPVWVHLPWGVTSWHLRECLFEYIYLEVWPRDIWGSACLSTFTLRCDIATSEGVPVWVHLPWGVTSRHLRECLFEYIYLEVWPGDIWGSACLSTFTLRCDLVTSEGVPVWVHLPWGVTWWHLRECLFEYIYLEVWPRDIWGSACLSTFTLRCDLMTSERVPVWAYLPWCVTWWHLRECLFEYIYLEVWPGDIWGSACLSTFTLRCDLMTSERVPVWAYLPWCVTSWHLRECLFEYCFPHTLHMNGFSPVCVVKCTASKNVQGQNFEWPIALGCRIISMVCSHVAFASMFKFDIVLTVTQMRMHLQPH